MFVMKKFIVLLLLLISTESLYSQQLMQDSKKVTLNGYVKYMNTIMDLPDNQSAFIGQPKGAWVNESMFHNRLNFRWYISNSFTFAAEARNRLIYGDMVEGFAEYPKLISQDNGYFDELTNNIIDKNAYLLNTSIDRLWVNYRKGKFEAKIGRQRINWGQAYVWNPNDIFNAYSFFDFDYEEKLGSDAIRLQYYPTFTSSAEVAVKVDNKERITAAGYYRFNKFGYDIQLLGGVLNDDEYVAGAGWSGNIKDAGFNGELTYIWPAKGNDNDSEILLSSVSANYMFDNSVYLMAEGYYNGNYKNMDVGQFSGFYFQDMSVKTLSFSELSWFAQASYPIHPLLDGTLAFMYYPDIDGYFINPSLKYSLTNNIQLSMHGQLFKGKFGSAEEETIKFLFFRFKWSYYAIKL